jgi:tRNA-splicing ligase RtcB (3'-phosphate/5'-hydroxy nucleic acid ligase)
MFAYKTDDFTVPIKVWLDRDAYFSEPKLVEQTERLAKLPFLHNHVVLTPDGHPGMGMPIGGVIACDRVVIPNAVGSDIGCGMMAVKTNLTELSRAQLESIVQEIYWHIPVGRNHSKTADPDACHRARTLAGWDGGTPICDSQWDSILYQIGTLGSGNHFLEIQQGDDGFIWFMIHSGSRNLGKQVADYYNEAAEDLNATWYSSVPKDWELAFLPMDTPIADAYIREMNYCLGFAQENRNSMAQKIMSVICRVTKSSVEFDEPINIHHNYAAMEHHYKKNVMLHRKGATRVRDGEIGIIPGSQGTKSYIVRGKGNPVSFYSCSHGAGRVMGRKEAIRTLDFDAVKAEMDASGIIHSIKDQSCLDEAPAVYKDIAEVMANQADLVDVLVELRPLAVVKG